MAKSREITMAYQLISWLISISNERNGNEKWQRRNGNGVIRMAKIS
jgi:hypothetical protein